MKITIKSKNIEITESLRSFIENKIGGLDKFVNVNMDIAVLVEVEKETMHHRKGDVFVAKAEIVLPGKKIMGEEKGDDLMKQIVSLKDELQQELKKYKSKKETEIRQQKKKKADAAV